MKNLASLSLILAMILMVSAGFGYATKATQDDQEKKQKQSASPTKASDNKSGQQDESVEGEFPAVDNLHHFMEYITKPTFFALKGSLAEAPSGGAEWRELKSHSLILAETIAIVGQRPPSELTEDQAKEWRQIARTVFDSAKLIYRIRRDYPKARKHYEELVDNCNHCHNVFIDGEHQQEK